MMLLRDSSSLPESCYGSVVAIGNFDGLHLGHQAVITQAVTHAQELGAPLMVLTFEPHPRRVFHPHLPPLRLMSWHSKLRLLREMGVDYLRVMRFQKSFAAISAEDFIKKILVETLHIRHVVTGEGFVFGHERRGNVAMLTAQGERMGFGTTACAPVAIEGERCSSSRIRTLLTEGNPEHAAKLLGHPYSLCGRVALGDQRGRTLGFPTANLRLPRLFIPAAGVYAVRVKLQGTTRFGVANLGNRPTFSGQEVRLETHIFDWDAPLYGEHVEVSLLSYLRAEQKFSGVDELKQQIALDCTHAREALTPFT